jgi:hypothetical protein
MDIYRQRLPSAVHSRWLYLIETDAFQESWPSVYPEDHTNKVLCLRQHWCSGRRSAIDERYWALPEWL